MSQEEGIGNTLRPFALKPSKLKLNFEYFCNLVNNNILHSDLNWKNSILINKKINFFVFHPLNRVNQWQIILLSILFVYQ